MTTCGYPGGELPRCCWGRQPADHWRPGAPIRPIAVPPLSTPCLPLPADKPNYGYRTYCTAGSISFNGCASGWGAGAVVSSSLDTYPGQSGSAIYRTSDRSVRATHSASGGGRSLHHAMTRDTYNWVMANRV